MVKIKIIDVAMHAGVSKSTVSQYLNGRFSHMSATTKEKISLAIKELNYVPNPIAQSLKREKTKTIGVIVRDICGFNTSRILRGIDDFCKKSAYKVLIYNTDFDEKIERHSLLTLKQMCVDGIIITSTGKNADLINEYTNSGFPVVQFQLEYEQCPTPIVLSDYKNAARQATEYLINLGHRRICFLTQVFEGNLSRTQRYLGYIQALKAHQIPFDENFIQYWDRDTGFAVAPKILLANKRTPTAFFTQHLAITTDLLKALNKEEIDIPQQVSVLGFDEIPMVDMFKVPISVIQQNSYAIGIESAKILLKLLSDDKKNEGRQKIIVPCTLIERDSCRKIS